MFEYGRMEDPFINILKYLKYLFYVFETPFLYCQISAGRSMQYWREVPVINIIFVYFAINPGLTTGSSYFKRNITMPIWNPTFNHYC